MRCVTHFGELPQKSKQCENVLLAFSSAYMCVCVFVLFHLIYRLIDTTTIEIRTHRLKFENGESSFNRYRSFLIIVFVHYVKSPSQLPLLSRG